MEIYKITLGDPDDAEIESAPVVEMVRLADVDKILAEAVWAMEEMMAHLDPYDGHYESYVKRAQSFLASPAVAAWREREKGKR